MSNMPVSFEPNQELMAAEIESQRQKATSRDLINNFCLADWNLVSQIYINN